MVMNEIRSGARDRGFVAILLIQMVVIFVVAPLAATGSASAALIEMLRFGLAAVTILIISRRLVVRAVVGLAFAATLIASIHWPLAQSALSVAAGRMAVTLVFDLVVATVVGFAAFRPGRVTVHRILGAVILYLYVALVFAGLYRLLGLGLAAAFSGLPPGQREQFAGLLYFSLGSLTTGSTGTIMAMHPLVRSLASLESVIGQLFPATLLARLVTLHASDAARD